MKNTNRLAARIAGTAWLANSTVVLAHTPERAAALETAADSVKVDDYGVRTITSYTGRTAAGGGTWRAQLVTGAPVSAMSYWAPRFAA